MESARTGPSQVRREEYRGSEEEDRRRFLHSTVGGSHFSARMGSDEALRGCRSGAQMHRGSFHSPSAMLPCWR